MSDQKASDVLGALPRTRPHRRSDKRPARSAAPASAPSAAKAKTTTAQARPTTAKAKPTTTPRARTRSTTAAATTKPATSKAKPSTAVKGRPVARPSPSRVEAQKASKPAPADHGALLGTAVQAAAELAEIGLSASARALRGAVARLPRP